MNAQRLMLWVRKEVVMFGFVYLAVELRTIGNRGRECQDVTSKLVT